MKILTRLAIQATGLAIQANGCRMQNKRALSFMRKDVSFSKKEDAEYVRNCMRNLIMEKGKATLKDLYELCGETSREEDENTYWTDLTASHVRASYNSYKIFFPLPDNMIEEL